jgi:hypothetical protein
MRNSYSSQGRRRLPTQCSSTRPCSSGLLMETGASYNKQKLHKLGYFKELLAINPDINEGLKPLLRLCRETLVRLQRQNLPWYGHSSVIRCWGPAESCATWQAKP